MSTSSSPIQKVLAYITRRQGEHLQLLVHRHRDFPEAGVQVPAGTVEAGEELEAALFREIEEESGLTDLILRAKLKQYLYYAAHKEQHHERHVYHLEIPPDKNVPEAFDHTIRSHDEDAGLVFCYTWVDVREQPVLEGGQGDCICMLPSSDA